MFFFKTLCILKGIERKGHLPSADSLPRWWYHLGLAQAGARSLVWVCHVCSRIKYLGHFPLFQAASRKLDQKWESVDMNQCLHGMRALQVAALLAMPQLAHMKVLKKPFRTLTRIAKKRCFFLILQTHELHPRQKGNWKPASEHSHGIDKKYETIAPLH